MQTITSLISSMKHWRKRSAGRRSRPWAAPFENRATGPIVGVVKDFNFSSLHDPSGPAYFPWKGFFPATSWCASKAAMCRVPLPGWRHGWKQRIADRPFNYHFLDDDYNQLYLAEQRSATLLQWRHLAIILACLGLFGLAALQPYNEPKRSASGGVRCKPCRHHLVTCQELCNWWA